MSTQNKPDWLKAKFNKEAVTEMADLLDNLSLNTVCTEANCPNLGECWKSKTATFMIMGNNCTRNCRYCNVGFGKPESLDKNEPIHISEAINALKLKHAVITSVTRDDLLDGGASHFANVITAIRENCENVTIEVLIPDFHGKEQDIDIVMKAGPDVLGHNLETVKRLYSYIKGPRNYETSLSVLKYARENYPDITTKTGIMLGLGEEPEDVYELMDDVRSIGCEFMTLGQYLRPTPDHIPVAEYIKPSKFNEYKRIGLEEKKFVHIASGPLVRSSYKAGEALEIKGGCTS